MPDILIEKINDFYRLEDWEDYPGHTDGYGSEPLPDEIRCRITGMEFVLVRGGSYLMGNSLDDGCKDESPAHEIVVEDFYLGKYPVTQHQWLKVMGYNPSNCGSSEQCPVDSVSCDMAMEFIFSLNHSTR